MPRESGVVCIRVPGRKPFFRCQISGVRHHLGTDRQQAYRRFAALIGPRPVTAPPGTVAEAVAGYLREQPGHWGETYLKIWSSASGMAALEALKPDALEKLARHLTPKYSISTNRQTVACAMAVLVWCHDRGWIAKLPRKPKLPRRPRMPRDIDPDSMAWLMDNLPSGARGKSAPLIRFIAATGCRPREARTLQWDAVNLQAKTCTLIAHKTAKRTGKIKTIYLTPDAIEILGAQPRTGPLVFPSRLGTAYTASGLRSIVRRRGVNAPYRLRHTFAQSALEAGTSMEVLAKLLGHGDLQTVQVYAQIRDRQALEAAARLGNLHRQSSAPKRPQRSGSKPKPKQARRARA